MHPSLFFKAFVRPAHKTNDILSSYADAPFHIATFIPWVTLPLVA